MPQRGEVVGGHDEAVGRGRIGGVGGQPPGHVEPEAVDVAAQRQGGDRRRRGHPGEGPHARQHVLVESHRRGDLLRRFALGETLSAGPQPHRQDAVGLETGLHRQQPGDAAHQHPGASEQHRGHRDVPGHQYGAGSPRAHAAGSTSRPAQLVAGVATGQLSQRRQAEQHTAGHRQQHRHTHRAGIERQPGQARQFRRTRGGHQPHRRPCRQQAEQRARRREQHRLGEELAHEPGPGHAQCRPHGHLRRSLAGAQQQQTGDVGAGDEQQHGHPAPQQEQRRTHRAEEHLTQARHARAGTRVGAGLDVGHPREQLGELGLGSRWRDARARVAPAPAGAGRSGRRNSPPGRSRAGTTPRRPCRSGWPRCRRSRPASPRRSRGGGR